ncbi:MAG: aminoglycoside phosphotransferase family protein [Roseiflexus sp.]|nr:aminoglycoside phosphotransferase family protein [Roseiflexus sp.]MCS7289774.1 aminoglycoside phosphotransferase family protein [Roseiflexus sp.]MDW8145743.1 phosphotransferase [Roseiflexaceae bacterium]MDW8232511.1 phosphotransferase [Roseiflexaceae bacterium]
MTLHVDDVFAPLDHDHVLERLAGGNETEVYWTDDRRYVVKLKYDLGGNLSQALQWARWMRTVADRYTACLGERYTIPNYFIVARGSDGRIYPLTVQPFLPDAQPLDALDYRALTPEQRARIALQLSEILRRAHAFYRTTGSMPDLYGRSTSSSDERKRMKALDRVPQRLWSFLVERTILRSHNLMLAPGSEPRIVLIDYDPVRKGRLYRLIYFTVRRILLLRDLAALAWLRCGAGIERKERDRSPTLHTSTSPPDPL